MRVVARKRRVPDPAFRVFGIQMELPGERGGTRFRILSGWDKVGHFGTSRWAHGRCTSADSSLRGRATRVNGPGRPKRPRFHEAGTANIVSWCFKVFHFVSPIRTRLSRGMVRTDGGRQPRVLSARGLAGALALLPYSVHLFKLQAWMGSNEIVYPNRRQTRLIAGVVLWQR